MNEVLNPNIEVLSPEKREETLNRGREAYAYETLITQIDAQISTIFSSGSPEQTANPVSTMWEKIKESVQQKQETKPIQLLEQQLENQLNEARRNYAQSLLETGILKKSTNLNAQENYQSARTLYLLFRTNLYIRGIANLEDVFKTEEDRQKLADEIAQFSVEDLCKERKELEIAMLQLRNEKKLPRFVSWGHAIKKWWDDSSKLRLGLSLALLGASGAVALLSAGGTIPPTVITALKVARIASGGFGLGTAFTTENIWNRFARGFGMTKAIAEHKLQQLKTSEIRKRLAAHLVETASFGTLEAEQETQQSPQPRKYKGGQKHLQTEEALYRAFYSRAQGGLKELLKSKLQNQHSPSEAEINSIVGNLFAASLKEAATNEPSLLEQEKILDTDIEQRHKKVRLASLAKWVTSAALGTASGVWMIERLYEQIKPKPLYWTSDSGRQIKVGEIQYQKKVIFQDGAQYYLDKDGKISVPLDRNHDGVINDLDKDANNNYIYVKINPHTGMGEYQGKTIKAWDKDWDLADSKEHRYSLVAREGKMVDISGDGQFDVQIWSDQEGLHCSHRLDLKGFSVKGPSDSNFNPITDPQASEFRNINNIFEYQFQFNHFVLHGNSLEENIKELAHQYCSLNTDNYTEVKSQGQTFLKYSPEHEKNLANLLTDLCSSTSGEVQGEQLEKLKEIIQSGRVEFKLVKFYDSYLSFLKLIQKEGYQTLEGEELNKFLNDYTHISRTYSNIQKDYLVGWHPTLRRLALFSKSLGKLNILPLKNKSK